MDQSLVMNQSYKKNVLIVNHLGNMMNLFLLVSAIFIVLACAQHRDTPEFELWVQKQHERALYNVLENVSPPDTLPGCIVAARSRTGAAAYWYNWVRDAALVTDALILEYETTKDNELRRLLEMRLWEYVSFTSVIQKTTSRSSTKTDPMGLGEPKYEVDGTPYAGEWGRPQLDGPGLRISSLVRFAKAYLGFGGDINRVKDLIYRAELPATKTAKIDSEMMARNILLESFDLWEEVRGMHFYTSIVQRRGLLDVAEFARFMNDSNAAQFYTRRIEQLENSIKSHWDGNGHISTTLNRTAGIDYKTSNLDSAVILGSLHSHGEKDNFFAVDSEAILATALNIRQVHGRAFAINRYRSDLPPGIGRYSEDQYFGGNPWFLTTLAMAEMNYRIISRAVTRGSFQITKLAVPYYHHIANGRLQSIVPAAGSTIKRNDPNFAKIADALAYDADGFFERARIHMSVDGSMDEQFDRNTGFMTGARDLTWSYASFVSAAASRRDAKLI